jgi:hypothetical protein
MKTDKYIKSISFKIGKNEVLADEAKIIMNKRKYKIEKSGIDRIKGDIKNEK